MYNYDSMIESEYDGEFVGDIYSNIVRIQKVLRGHIHRIKRLPQIMYSIKEYLKSSNIKFSLENDDGRINSCNDEEVVLSLLKEKYKERVRIPKKRMWYDLLIYDMIYGWLPVNIKTTTTKTSDNTGNLAMCVYAYTDEEWDLDRVNSYDNGKMSKILIDKIKKKEYNKKIKKDYYFIVLNKTDISDVIINSVKGLTILTPNVNNLPFQVTWDKNRSYNYEKVENKIEKFIECLKKPKPSWKEEFMTDIRLLS